jgi:hypothetical protein
MRRSLTVAEEFAAFSNRAADGDVGAPTVRSLGTSVARRRKSERESENERQSTPSDHQRNLG